MELIYRHIAVAPVLANYPKSHWKHVVLALAVCGIRSLKENNKLASLSIDQIEDLCSVQSNKNRDKELAVCMKELNTIKKELSKLDKRFDEAHGNKENTVVASNNSKGEAKTQSVRKTVDSAKPKAARPSSAWRAKGTGKNSSKQIGVYPPWWPKTTHENAQSESGIRSRAKSTAVTPMRSKRLAASKKPENSASKGTLRSLPSYLKNVQSRILGDIEQAKMEYTKKQKEQLRTQQIALHNSETDSAPRMRGNYTQQYHKANSRLQKKHLQYEQRMYAHEELPKYKANEQPTWHADAMSTQKQGVSGYLKKAQERFRDAPILADEPEELVPDYKRLQEKCYPATQGVNFARAADKYSGSYIIEHFSKLSAQSQEHPCRPLAQHADDQPKYTNLVAHSIEPHVYSGKDVVNDRYNEIKAAIHSQSIETGEQRFRTLSKPTAVSANMEDTHKYLDCNLRPWHNADSDTSNDLLDSSKSSESKAA